MSNTSIFGKGWIDLVFEGRNKAYGAYQLRQENERTTGIAFLYALGFVALIGGLVAMMSSFKAAPLPPASPEPIEGTIVVTYIPNPPKPKGADLPPLKRTEEPEVEVPKEKLINPVVVTAEDDPTDVMTNKEAAKPETNPEGSEDGIEMRNPGAGGSGSGSGAVPGGGDTEGSGDDPDGLVNAPVLDRQPEFPGGMAEFYKRVARDFRTPEDVDAGGSKIKVNVQFVIEKDGTLTDIKALNNPGYGLDKEAIRMLKAMKVKWTPGILKGKKVRTVYVLPISVSMR